MCCARFHPNFGSDNEIGKSAGIAIGLTNDTAESIVIGAAATGAITKEETVNKGNILHGAAKLVNETAVTLPRTDSTFGDDSREHVSLPIQRSVEDIDRCNVA